MVVQAAVAGPISDIGPYLRMRSPLVDAAKLLNRPDFAALDIAVRKPLKVDHDARTRERDGMLPEADSVDNLSNNRLGPWNDRLNEALAKLDAETALYVADVGTHRAQCAPARDQATWEWCLKDKERLDKWLASLNTRGDAHNEELARFHIESKPYDARLAALVAKIETWTAAVNDLIARIESALKKNTGTCTEAEFDRLDGAITELCKRAKWACTEDQTCSVLLANLNAGQKCHDARKAVMDQCFAGGDPVHEGVLREVQNGIDRCRRIYRDKCGGVGAAGEVP